MGTSNTQHRADEARRQRTDGERMEAGGDARERPAEDGRGTDLRDSPMMAHLLDALEAGTDIGHYGRLTFAMVARHFLPEEELVALLARQPDHDEQETRALLRQVEGRDYNPPTRERILEWQARQDFPICPNPEDPGACNVYRELRFPDDVYANIGEFWEQRAEAEREAEGEHHAGNGRAR